MITAKEATSKSIKIKNRMNHEIVEEMLKQILNKVERNAVDGLEKIEYNTEGFASDNEIKSILKELDKLGYNSFIYSSHKQSEFSNGKFESHTIDVGWGTKGKVGFIRNLFSSFIR